LLFSFNESSDLDGDTDLEESEFEDELLVDELESVELSLEEEDEDLFRFDSFFIF
jgi:hypothetical protein